MLKVLRLRMKKCVISCCCNLGSDMSINSNHFHPYLEQDKKEYCNTDCDNNEACTSSSLKPHLVECNATNVIMTKGAPPAFSSELSEQLTLLDESIVKKLDSCLLHLHDVYVYTVSDVKEFLAKIPQYQAYLNKLEFQLKNASDLIKLYCQRLRHTIETETKYLISKLNPTDKTEIEDMNVSHKELIEKVNKYENNLFQSLVQVDKKINKLLVDIKRMKQSVERFDKIWHHTLMNETPYMVSELKEAKKIHQEFQLNLKNLINETKYLIFNNRLMVFEKNKSKSDLLDNLVGCVYIKQSIDLSQSNQIDLSEILTGNDIQWEVFDNGNYIFICKNPADSESKIVILFEPTERKVLKKLQLKKSFVESIKRNGNLCAIQCSGNDLRSLIIIDDNLRVVKEKFHHYRLLGADDSHLFLCHNGDKMIKTFDWSLNECKWYIIKFQDTDRLKPFFIESDLLIDEFHRIYNESLIEYLIHTYSYKNENEQDLVIYQENGEQLKQLKLDQKGECKLESGDQIVLLNGKQLKYFDLNGDLFKIVDLFGADIHSFDFTFDKNNRIHVLDPNALKMYF